jgi:hypothetical protein
VAQAAAKPAEANRAAEALAQGKANTPLQAAAKEQEVADAAGDLANVVDP